jgi:hypothetical protein
MRFVRPRLEDRQQLRDDAEDWIELYCMVWFGMYCRGILNGSGQRKARGKGLVIVFFKVGGGRMNEEAGYYGMGLDWSGS